MHADTGATPQHCTPSESGHGELLLTYAVRGGASLGIAALGSLLGLVGAWGAWKLLSSGGLTAAGFVFLLVPLGALLASLYCLDIALHASTSYLLGADALTVRRDALFGGSTARVARRAVTEVSQRYSPPGTSAPTGADGTWVTAISYRDNGGDPAREIVLDGLGSAAEARWLARQLAPWAGVPVRRGYAGGFEEADPKELPRLEP